MRNVQGGPSGRPDSVLFHFLYFLQDLTGFFIAVCRGFPKCRDDQTSEDSEDDRYEEYGVPSGFICYVTETDTCDRCCGISENAEDAVSCGAYSLGGLL